MGGEESTDQREKHNVVVDADVLKFSLMRIWPKDANAMSTLHGIVRLLEEGDPRLFQISKKIGEKVIDRAELISRLNHLKSRDLNKFNASVYAKEKLLSKLYKVQENFSSPKPCSNNEEKLQNHKMNFLMLHKTKSLAQEKQFLREINVNQHKDNASISPMEETSKTLSEILRWYKYSNYRHLRICQKLYEEIKQFEVTRKFSEGLRESIRYQIKTTLAELMDMRKTKKTLETKVKHFEEEIEAINEQISSFQKHLKKKYHRKRGYTFPSEGEKVQKKM